MKWDAQLFFLLLCFVLVRGLDNPYKILGIHRSATVPEIRKAYKQLAKEWHPDKNDDPTAETKFVEITQAYELLTDPERRKMFDTFGRVEETRTRRDTPYKRFDPFDEIFVGTGFRFQFTDRDITLFHKLSITSRAYENIVVPKSFRTPHLLLFYSDWCFACLQVEPVWRRIMEELEPIGVGIATVHADNEKSLARKASVHSLPCLVLLADGRISVYKESLFSVQKVVEFVRNKMPYKMVPTVTDENVDAFLSGWSDNKVRALVFQRNESIRLRYLITAFYHRDRVAFGFVPPGAEGVRARYQVSNEQDALLVFNEIKERPVASVTMAYIPVHTMHDVINSNNYLLLPRLSSQALLDALCPAGLPQTRKRLCVVLVCQDTPNHDPHRQSLRRFASESHYAKDRVRFMYIYQERQPEFISALTAGKDSPAEPLLHVAILCRRDISHVKYEWLGGGEDWESYNNTKQRLETAIDRVLHTTQSLLNEAVIGELIDEHTQGIVSRIFTKLLLAAEYLNENLGKEHILPAVSVFATILVIVAAGYFMSYLMKLEEARVQEECGDGVGEKGRSNGSGYTPQLKLHDMRAETYNGLVRLLRPGCRTILLLVDTQSKPQLLPKFHKVVWPYRKNKTLMFAILNLDRGLSWYREVLAQSLPEPRELRINPRNCVGTVLALNGLRKYFCMYHAKHPECGSGSGSKRMRSIMNKQMALDPAGAFMGFDDSTSESDLSDVEQGNTQAKGDKYGDVIFIENLLDGLPNWLDRLFEGTTHRYYVNYWPDFPTK